MKTEVGFLHQSQTVSRLSSFSVGETICTEDSSQRLTDPVAVRPSLPPLTNVLSQNPQNCHYHSGGNSFQEISRVLAPTPATEYLGGQEIDPRPSIVEFDQVSPYQIHNNFCGQDTIFCRCRVQGPTLVLLSLLWRVSRQIRISVPASLPLLLIPPDLIPEILARPHW